MTKSKYEFKNFKSKPLSRITESTAVRVVVNAVKRISSGWKKFRVATSNTITNIVTDNIGVNEMTRMAAKVEANQNLIDDIKKEEEVTRSDLRVMDKAIKENEKLTKRIRKFNGKDSALETKICDTRGLKEALDAELGKENGVGEPNSNNLSAAFDSAGIPKLPEIKNVNMPITEAPKVENVIHANVAEKQDEVATNNVVMSPVVSSVIEAIKNVKQLGIVNERLTMEAKEKDEKISTLETTVNTLTNQNKELTNTNNSQTAAMASLSKENDSLKVAAKDQVALETRIREYESIASRREVERQEMIEELKKLRYSTSDSLARVGILEKELAKVTKERDVFQTQFNYIYNAVNVNGQAPTTQVGEENKTR